MVDPAILDPLRLADARVKAVAKVHDMLHAQGSTGALDLGAYVRALCASLAAALGAEGRGLRSWWRSSP
jgi:two-component sensor histidine kinase